jgi:hypothetical protein
MFYRSVMSKPALRFVELVVGAMICVAIMPLPRVSFADEASRTDAGAGARAEKPKMLRHAVFFRFKDGTSQEDVKKVVDAFRALPAKIAEIRGFQLGENVSHERGGGFTHCFFLTFDDEAGRAAYLPHPAHKEFGSVLRPHLDKVFVVDYWGQPQPEEPKKAFKHAVFFKFKAGTPKADVEAVETGLAALPEKIDVIRGFEWGTNNSPEKHDQGFTHCFMFTFDSERALKEYAQHRDHVKEARFLLPKMDKVRVIDFWAEEVPVQHPKRGG